MLYLFIDELLLTHHELNCNILMPVRANLVMRVLRVLSGVINKIAYVIIVVVTHLALPL